MGIKKKLGLGMATAALGLSLIGGGTYAYFSDEVTIHNGLAAGTLDLKVTGYDQGNWAINFDLQNLRPGDTVERTFDLRSVGSLAIGDTYLDFSEVVVQNPLNTGAGSADFLSALQVNYFVDTVQNGEYQPQSIVTAPISLKDAIDGNYTGKIASGYLKDGKLNLTPEGIEAGSFGRFRVMITFPETNVPQNQFQGMVAKFDFNLEARQVIGYKYYGGGTSNGTISGNGKVDLNDKTVSPAGTGLVDPDQVDVAPWIDQNN